MSALLPLFMKVNQTAGFHLQGRRTAVKFGKIIKRVFFAGEGAFCVPHRRAVFWKGAKLGAVFSVWQLIDCSLPVSPLFEFALRHLLPRAAAVAEGRADGYLFPALSTNKHFIFSEKETALVRQHEGGFLFYVLVTVVRNSPNMIATEVTTMASLISKYLLKIAAQIRKSNSPSEISPEASNRLVT